MDFFAASLPFAATEAVSPEREVASARLLRSRLDRARHAR